MPLPTKKPWLSLTATIGTAKAPIDGTTYWVRLPDYHSTPVQLAWDDPHGQWAMPSEPFWPNVPWYLATEYRAV